MNTRKNQILSLLIVGAMAAIGTSATKAYAVVITVHTKAKLVHPVLLGPIFLHGAANVKVACGMIDLGTYLMSAPNGKAKIKWYPPSVNPADGSFTANGRGMAKLINPATGAIERVYFRMITHGRTDSVARVKGRFTYLYTSVPGAGLKGKYRH